MKAKPQTIPLFLLFGHLAAATASTSQAAIIYLSTNLDQTNVTGPVELSATTNFTGLLNTGDATANTTIEENRTTAAADIEPTGQHLRVDGNMNKHATMENTMTLTTDGITSLTLSFSYLLTGDAPNNELRILYSSLGNFSDAVELRTYVITGSSRVNGSVPNQTTVTDNVWNQTSFSVTPPDVTFSNTAKIRFAQDSSSSINSAFYMDDIVITGVPEPASTGLLALSGLVIFRRRR